MQTTSENDEYLVELAYSTTYKSNIRKYAAMCETESARQRILAFLDECHED